MAGFGAAGEAFDPTEAPAPLLELAAADALGGVILFRRNIAGWPQLTRLTRDIRAAFPDPTAALVAVDQEGGRVARLGPPVLTLPPMRALGALANPALTERLFEGLGAQLHALGFNVNMAPVLDVDTNPDNPIIGDRSFGRGPAVVIEHGRAVIAGLTSAGIAACGKHFPGHGDTLLDSHLALPRLTHDLARLQRVELAPFAALASQLPTLMTAHVVFEALSPDTPATLSPRIMTDLLRQELGFAGPVFSDDLEMKALADHHSVADAACGAIAAGCDALLICSEVERSLSARSALASRARADRDFAARLLDAAQRVTAIGKRFPGNPTPSEPPSMDGLQAELAERLGQTAR